MVISDSHSAAVLGFEQSSGVKVHDATEYRSGFLDQDLVNIFHREITRKNRCRLILNDIILHIKFLNDINMFTKKL